MVSKAFEGGYRQADVEVRALKATEATGESELFGGLLVEASY